MSKSTINNKCKNCAGELVFDPDSGELKCLQCETIVDIPELNTIAPKKPYGPNSELEKSESEYAQYHCETCGRKHIVPSSQEVINCPSCGDPTNLTRTVNVEYIPDAIIPFKLNKEKALNCFKDWIRGRKFAPNNLKKLAKTEFITGMYLPIYNYDFDTITHYSGVGVNTYTDSNNRRHTTRHPFRSSRADKYTNYVDSANSLIPSKTLREIANFDFNKCCVYRTEFLYGWIGSEINIELHDSSNRIRISAAEEIKQNVRRSLNYDRIENFVCNTTFSNMRYNHLYIPLYTSNYKYKDKTYNCYINGITGKVSGKAPKSGWKIFFTVLFFGALIAGGVYLLGLSGL